MHNIERVKILCSQTNLSDKVDTIRLGQRIILISNLDEELSTINVLHQDHNKAVVNEAVNVLYDVLMVDNLENLNFLQSFLLVTPPPGLDELGCIFAQTADLFNKKHCSKFSLSQLTACKSISTILLMSEIKC